MLIQVLSNRYDLVQPYVNNEQTLFVLMQSGVYLLPQLLENVSAQRIKVLETDWLASGLAHQGILKDKQIYPISAAQWVALCIEHHNVMTVQ